MTAAAGADWAPPSLVRSRGLSGAGVLGAAVLIYGLLLQVGYTTIMVPRYGHLGFHYRAPAGGPYLLAISLVVGVALVMPRKVRHVSDLLLWLMYIMVFVPSVLISQYNPLVSQGTATLLGLNMAACLLLARGLASVRPRMHLEALATDLRPLFAFFAVLMVIGLVAYLAYSGGLSTELIGLRDVYTQRADFRETQASLVAYLAPAFYNVLGPAFLAMGLLYRRQSLVAVGLGLQLILFLSIAFKTILFSIAVVWLLYRAFRGRAEITASKLVLAAGGGAVLCVVVDRVVPALELTDLFVRRLIYFPGVISDVYMSVFAGQGKTNFFEVLPFTTSDAAAPGTPALVVGQLFFGGDVNANASLWMHGFASYGYPGMYLETLVFVGILWLVDDVSRGLPRPVAMSIFIMPGLAISESSIFSSLLTHGVLAALVVAALVPRGTHPDGVSEPRPRPGRRPGRASPGAR